MLAELRLVLVDKYVKTDLFASDFDQNVLGKNTFCFNQKSEIVRYINLYTLKRKVFVVAFLQLRSRMNPACWMLVGRALTSNSRFNTAVVLFGRLVIWIFTNIKKQLSILLVNFALLREPCRQVCCILNSTLDTLVILDCTKGVVSSSSGTCKQHFKLPCYFRFLPYIAHFLNMSVCSLKLEKRGTRLKELKILLIAKLFFY